MRTNSLIVSISGAMFGLGLVGIGGYLAVDAWNFSTHGVKTTGVVSSHTASRGKQRPLITFVTANGEKHLLSGQTWDDAPRGSQIDVLYDPAPPYRAVIAGFSPYRLSATIASLGLLVILLTFGVPTFLARHENKKKARLMAEGKRVTAVVKEIKEHVLYGRKGKQPSGYYLLTADWTDPANGTAHTFLKMVIPKQSIHLLDLKEVAVYLNPVNPKDYWVDTDTV